VGNICHLWSFLEYTTVKSIIPVDYI